MIGPRMFALAASLLLVTPFACGDSEPPGKDDGHGGTIAQGGEGGPGGNPGTGGSGGTVQGSTGGSGGGGGDAFASLPDPRCTNEETTFAKSLGERGGGFQGIRVGADSTEATIVETGSSFLRLELASGEEGTFAWPSSLPLEIPEGAQVRIGWQERWQVLVSDHGTLAVLSSSDMGSTHASFAEGAAVGAMLATHCYFPLEDSGCEADQARGELQSVVAGFSPLGRFGAVVIRPGQKSRAAGWTLENHGAVFLPGNRDEGDCVIESWHSALITAHTPHAEAAPF